MKPKLPKAEPTATELVALMAAKQEELNDAVGCMAEASRNVGRITSELDLLSMRLRRTLDGDEIARLRNLAAATGAK